MEEQKIENNETKVENNESQQTIENQEIKVEEEKCKYECAFGIDFGSTKLVAALTTRDIHFPILVRNSMSNRITPCYISLKGNHRYIGEEGLTHASRNPTGTVNEVKTILGRTKEEMENLQKLKAYKINANEISTIDIEWDSKVRNLYPEHLTSMLITQVAQNVTKAYDPETTNLDHAVKDCVVAVPYCWNERQLKSLRDSFGMSGIRVVRFIHDITAAALCYGVQKKIAQNETKTILFIDIGQNYVSAQICKFEENKMKIISTSSKNIGASNIDEAITQFLISEFKAKNKIDLNNVPTNTKALYRIRKESNSVKEVLSTIPKTTVNIEALYDGIDLRVELTREKFEQLSSHVLDEIEKMILDTIKDNNFDFVETIGGGQRIPCVKDRLAKCCNKELRYTLDSEHSIAFGAALLGAIHSGKTFNQNSNFLIEGDILENVSYSDWQLPTQIVEECSSLEIEMMTRDQINHDTAKIKNDLESFIFETRQFIDQEDLQSFINEEQKKQLTLLLLDFDEWCVENQNEVLTTYQSKFNNLKEESRKIATSFFERIDFLNEEKKRLHSETNQEAPQKINKSEKKLRPEEKLKLAEEKKDQGNKHFGNLDYMGAITRYIQAISILDEVYGDQEEIKQKTADLKLTIYLNLAMSNLKLKNYSKSVANCTNALKIDPKNVKALFRRSIAKSSEKLYDDALKDLQEASNIDPNNKDVKKELTKIKSIIQQQKEKEKKMYSKMFG